MRSAQQCSLLLAIIIQCISGGTPTNSKEECRKVWEKRFDSVDKCTKSLKDVLAKKGWKNFNFDKDTASHLTDIPRANLTVYTVIINKAVKYAEMQKICSEADFIPPFITKPSSLSWTEKQETEKKWLAKWTIWTIVRRHWKSSRQDKKADWYREWVVNKGTKNCNKMKLVTLDWTPTLQAKWAAAQVITKSGKGSYKFEDIKLTSGMRKQFACMAFIPLKEEKTSAETTTPVITTVTSSTVTTQPQTTPTPEKTTVATTAAAKTDSTISPQATSTGSSETGGSSSTNATSKPQPSEAGSSEDTTITQKRTKPSTVDKKHTTAPSAKKPTDAPSSQMALILGAVGGVLLLLIIIVAISICIVIPKKGAKGKGTTSSKSEVTASGMDDSGLSTVEPGTTEGGESTVGAESEFQAVPVQIGAGQCLQRAGCTCPMCKARAKLLGEDAGGATTADPSMMSME